MRIETYLRLAYKAYTQGIEVIGPSFIAKELEISRPSAYEGLIKLASMEYGEYIPGEGFKLNKKGIERGKEITKKHRLIECLLGNLGFDAESACTEATKLEPFISKELSKRLEEVFRDRVMCPCGEEIELGIDGR
jgi:DtxR family Mn-dependent transcriptional regulator